jgi:flavin reductase (DIM6/NTAB) family NADH-FMN oxidoreductase RutF
MPSIRASQIPDLPSSFRNAMRRLAATVSIVTCMDGDGWHGMTATAITSVSVDPPALLVCVNAAAAFYSHLSSSENFCVNLLASPHVQISQDFGGKLRGAERFARGNWTLARELPCLIDAQANLFCKTETRTHFGTHGIFIGSVKEARFSEVAAPLVYQDGHYVKTSPLAVA